MVGRRPAHGCQGNQARLMGMLGSQLRSKVSPDAMPAPAAADAVLQPPPLLCAGGRPRAAAAAPCPAHPAQVQPLRIMQVGKIVLLTVGHRM